ncbi:MAG: zf-TFIIB domain-containing protein [Synechococcaceae cyanobacterium]|nr:zf-TFIIB domain-containing protein [Synechococcaceae cyanobacterium]
MNCPCCSAPLQGGGTACSYCGSRLDLDLQGWSHLQPRGLNPLLHCPDCHGPLESLQLGGDVPLELDRCPDCLGLFLPLGALERLLQQSGASVLQIDHRLLQALSEAPRAAPSPWRYRPCPSCGALMHRNLHGKRSGVVVDRCRDHGLWLDAGELRQLLEWARAGGVLLDQERRREQAEQEAKEEARQRQQTLSFLAEAEAEEALARRRSWLDPRPRDDLLTVLVRLARRLR